MPLCNHLRLSKNPANDHTARIVKVMKSDIIALNETKSRFSDMTLNASRGISTGAAQLSISKDRIAKCLERSSLDALRA
jgi:hypothetical protein